VDAQLAISMIKEKFAAVGSPVSVPNRKGKLFTAKLTPHGINVDDLANQPFLPWAVFEEAVRLLSRSSDALPPLPAYLVGPAFAGPRQEC
jgi:hypothetical protein